MGHGSSEGYRKFTPAPPFLRPRRETYHKPENKRISCPIRNRRLVFPEAESPQSHPAMIMVCDFSKFVLTRFISSVNPARCIDFLLSYWVPLFGYPNNFLCDNSTSFQGLSWQAVCHNFNIRIIHAPPRAAFQIGLAERHVGLVKMGYQAIPRADCDGLSRNQRLSRLLVRRKI